MTDHPNPGNTLYINNLYEKINHDDLVESLRVMFQRYGNVIDIIARRTYKLRGQAWVVFERSEDATKAMEELNGFRFMTKPIRIAYAKTKSDAVARLDGSYVEEEAEARRQKRRDAWNAKVEEDKRREEEARESKAQGRRKEGRAPRCTILVENIPREANEGMLLLVFQRFAGLKEVRMGDALSGTAQVEYDNEQGAAAAVAGLQGFKLATDKPMRLTVLD